MAEQFDSYRKWLGIPPEEQPPNYYRLLGVAIFERDADVILHAADRQIAHVRIFQTGRYAAASQQILNELSSARVCLLDPTKRAAYDALLRSLGWGAQQATPVATANPSGPVYPGQASPQNNPMNPFPPQALPTPLTPAAWPYDPLGLSSGGASPVRRLVARKKSSREFPGSFGK